MTSFIIKRFLNLKINKKQIFLTLLIIINFIYLINNDRLLHWKVLEYIYFLAGYIIYLINIKSFPKYLIITILLLPFMNGMIYIEISIYN